MNRLHNSDEIESIRIYLNEDDHPKAFEGIVQLLTKAGIGRKKAVKYTRTTPIDLELYFEKDHGIMAVEEDAAEAGTIYSPFTGEMYTEAES